MAESYTKAALDGSPGLTQWRTPSAFSPKQSAHDERGLGSAELGDPFPVNPAQAKSATERCVKGTILLTDTFT